MSRLALDTSAYIAHMRNHPPVRDALRRAPVVGVSAVVVGELRAGFLKGSKLRLNERLLAEFLASPRVEVLPIDEETAERYAAICDYLRQVGKPIPSNDIWIAASAARHGLALLTLDEHFKRVPHVLVYSIEPLSPA